MLEHLERGGAFVRELESAILPLPSPDDPVHWNGREKALVADVRELERHIERLDREDFGVATGGASTGSRWGQVMEVGEPAGPRAYIVEVHDGTMADWAQRVFRGGGWRDYPESLEGLRDLHDFEVFPAEVAAGLLWTWIHVGLPAGYLRTLRHLSPSERLHYGV